MKYTSVFENIEGQRYAVVITTEGVSAPMREVTAGASPFTTEMAENDMASSKRKETKELIAQLKKTNPLIESNIFNALHAVAIKCFPGVVVSGHHYTINDFYSNLDEDIPNPYRQ